jgi:hypothetical protein
MRLRWRTILNHCLMKKKNHLSVLEFGVAGMFVLLVMTTMKINHLAVQNVAAVGKDQKPEKESVVLVLAVLWVAVLRVWNKKIGVLLVDQLMIGKVLVEKWENLLVVVLIDQLPQILVTRISRPDRESAARLLTQVRADHVRMMMPYQLNTYHLTRLKSPMMSQIIRRTLMMGLFKSFGWALGLEAMENNWGEKRYA